MFEQNLRKILNYKIQRLKIKIIKHLQCLCLFPLCVLLLTFFNSNILYQVNKSSIAKVLLYKPDDKGSKLTHNFDQNSNISYNFSISKVSRSNYIDKKVEFIDLSNLTSTVEKKPFYSDKKCRKFHKRLYEEGSFNLTALVSYPGSGNTWARHLVELATGIYTGSVYSDLELFSRGFLGELEDFRSGSTIVSKTHLKYSTLYSEASKAIILIRNPYDAIVSFVQFLEGGHLGSASPITFKRKEWPRYVLSETYKWISLTKSWLEQNSIPLLIVHYENLKSNTKQEMHRICIFLKIDCQKNLESSCFKSQIEGKFRRKITRNYKKDPKILPNFPIWVRRKVDSGIDYLNRLIVRHGHEQVPLNLYTLYRNYTVLSK